MRRDSANRLGQASDQEALMRLVQAIVDGDTAGVREILRTSPQLGQTSAAVGASRPQAVPYFFPSIGHYLYAGDTPLHMAAAAFRVEIAQMLIDSGASCAARNRRGAEPLHYASDANIWNSAAQAATVECLIRAGADPNAMDKSGVAAIHRAVRTRAAAALEALLAGGADAGLPNKSGSTPLHLAVQTTGKSGSGTPEAVAQQRRIILLLLRSGAALHAKDGSGRTVHQAATADWIVEMLDTAQRG
jgi:ankyrin repeat protein